MRVGLGGGSRKALHQPVPGAGEQSTGQAPAPLPAPLRLWLCSPAFVRSSGSQGASEAHGRNLFIYLDVLFLCLIVCVILSGHIPFSAERCVRQ